MRQTSIFGVTSGLGRKERERERVRERQINKLDFKIHDMYIRIEIFGLYAYKNISDVLVPHIVLKFFG